jgi:hypothetical protein
MRHVGLRENGTSGKESGRTRREGAVAKAEFRRREGDGTHRWHCCSNCKDWPTAHFESAQTRGKPVCHECESLERRQMCTKDGSYYM